MTQTLCPYAEGNTINLLLQLPNHPNSNPTVVDARITKIFEPFTLSCVMLIVPDPESSSSLPGGLLLPKEPMVLKVFDQRFATGLRKDFGAQPWSTKMELGYQRFVVDGGASGFLDKLKTNDDKVLYYEESDDWNDAQKEVFLYKQAGELYEAETEVYRRMSSLQGKDIPVLLGHVMLPGSQLLLNNVDGAQYINSPGFLLQYIPGFPLTDIAECASREKWQGICEEAIRIVNCISDKEIMNSDVQTRNFIIEKDFNVFMIDFACCTTRGPDQDETDWRRLQAHRDEEGAVGRLMERRLKGGFVYRRSRKYEKLDDDFLTETPPESPVS